MSIKTIDQKPFEITLISDTEEPKTVFVVTPLKQFEYLRIASFYQKFFGDMTNENSIEKFVEKISGSDSNELEELVRQFFVAHVIEIRDVKHEGKLATLKKDKINIDILNLQDALEVISQTVARISVTEEERKN
jgi:hypothetical protein